jgi:hypothetical protein
MKHRELIQRARYPRYPLSVACFKAAKKHDELQAKARELLSEAQAPVRREDVSDAAF